MKIFGEKFRCLLIAGSIVVLIPLLIWGVFIIGYEYTYYRDYKSVKHIKLRHIHGAEYNRFEIDLDVEFVEDRYDKTVVQLLYVQDENRKGFLIYRFEDQSIQLLKLPFRKYWGLKYLSAFYRVSSPESVKKLQKLLMSYDDVRNREEM